MPRNNVACLLEATFIEYGTNILGEKNLSPVEFSKQFISLFGTTPFVCARAWELISAKKRGRFRRGASPEHLLWALLFLKSYSKEAQISAMVNRHAKTVRKWIWYFIRCLSSIRDDVVSSYDEIKEIKAVD